MICLFHRMGKHILEMSLKSSIISKLDHQMSKIEYLIAQLRTDIWKKNFRLKTCPQGVLQAQEEK